MSGTTRRRYLLMSNDQKIEKIEKPAFMHRVDIYFASPFRKRHVAEAVLGAGAGVGGVELLNQSYGTDYSHLVGAGIGAVVGVVVGETLYAVFTPNEKLEAKGTVTQTQTQSSVDARMDELEDAVSASLGRVEARLAAPPVPMSQVMPAQAANDQLTKVMGMLAAGQQKMAEGLDQLARSLIDTDIDAPPTRKRTKTAS